MKICVDKIFTSAVMIRKIFIDKIITSVTISNKICIGYNMKSLKAYYDYAKTLV